MEVRSDPFHDVSYSGFTGIRALASEKVNMYAEQFIEEQTERNQTLLKDMVREALGETLWPEIEPYISRVIFDLDYSHCGKVCVEKHPLLKNFEFLVRPEGVYMNFYCLNHGALVFRNLEEGISFILNNK